MASTTIDSATRDLTNAGEHHRDAAVAALALAETNPILSAEELFRSAEVHALLAIEGRLAELARKVALPS
jgi:hypothetical protein